MNWILQWSHGVKEQTKRVSVHAHTGWVKSSLKCREETKWQTVFQSLSCCLTVSRLWKHVSDKKLSSCSPKYLLVQTKTRCNLFPPMFPEKQSSPGLYSCKSKIIAGTRELKMYREKEIHSIASVALTVTRRSLTDWMISKPVPAKLVTAYQGSGVQ